MKTRWAVAFGVLCGLLAGGLLFLIFSQPRGQPVQLLPPPTASPIVVHVSGAVQNPGVYHLPTGSRIIDALNAAGGLLVEANPSHLNFAAFAQDGSQIYVYSMEEAEVSSSNGASPPLAPYYPININTASLEELDLLPGIGPVKAQAIVDYREEHGAFGSIEEVMEVPGIGPGTFEEIRDLITV